MDKTVSGSLGTLFRAPNRSLTLSLGRFLLGSLGRILLGAPFPVLKRICGDALSATLEEHIRKIRESEAEIQVGLIKSRIQTFI